MKRILPFVYGLLLLLLGSVSPPAFTQTNSPDSIRVAIEPAYDEVGRFHRFWLGEGYRKLWAAPVTLRVLDLDKEKGGLKPKELGGGFQTKSLRLKDASGKEWVLRSVQKYPERGLPANLRKTIAKKILRDQVVTVHPFGALTVPPFAKALGLSHTNPQVVYVGNDLALGEYANEFANSVLLFEERGALDTFRTIKTEKLQNELEGKKNVRVDQKMVLRARLLDMLMGDWDRHEGQWRWEQRVQEGRPVYYPVPHDRDYVFYHTTGVLPWLISKQWQTARFQGFQRQVRDIETYNFNNRFFDRYFLNTLDEEEWQEQIAFVQKTVSDELIRSAVKRMPDTIFALSGNQIVQTLMERRNNLKADAMRYYRFHSKIVDIPASDKDEKLLVQYKEGGKIDVVISSKGEKLFHRRFDPEITEEIRIYGLGGKDVFYVEGENASPITVRFIGGEGVDSSVITGKNANRNTIHIYDQKSEANKYAAVGKLHLSSDKDVNSFDRRNFKYNLSAPVINLFYNVDQRTFASLGWMFQNHSFRKEPFASRHQVMGGYSAVRGSFAFQYSGYWRQVFGKFGLSVNLLSIGPNNQSNFFGTGNETRFNERNGNSLSYHRNFYDFVNADMHLTKPVNANAFWHIGPAAQFYTDTEEKNKNRFLKIYQQQNPDEAVFESKWHTGVSGGVTVDTRQNRMLPASGIFFTMNARAMKQVNGEKRSFGAVVSEVSFFTKLDKDSGVVLVNRLNVGVTLGSPYFYQMMQLGGPRSLRGYNLNRFTGRSMLLHSAELRVKLFDFTSWLFPGTVGMIALNDVGRVWMPEESSTTWHHGYGGGLYVVPADVLMLRAVVARSVEGTQLYVNFVFGLQ
ncbi:MAG TPA: BamA/TamA family outer membrane protein [Flavisolibacter sp.]|nr:BamA/TamA family outer membrane protein [Flavisolibacter sp.]